MRTLKLMPDYQCFPLWEASPGQVGNVDPSSLPISEALRADLLAWAEVFEAGLDWDDPGNSPPPTPQEAEAFRVEGLRLADALRAELGEGWPILVWDGLSA